MQLKEIAGEHYLVLSIDGAGTAGTPAEFCGAVAPFKAKVSKVVWVPNANITANGTNYFTLTLRNRKADGSGTVQPATRSYAATNSTGLVPENMTLSSTASDLQVAAGDHLTVEKLVSGTGLAMPAGTVQVYLQAA